MMASRLYCFGLASIAWLGTLIPSPGLLAQEWTSNTPRGIDVRLDQQGAFVGRLVDAHGAPLRNVRVSLRREGQEICCGTTDQNGEFRVQPTQGGTLELNSGTHQVTLRCWPASLAPPQALSTIQLVQGPIERGQSCTTESCTTPSCDPCGSNCGVLGFLMNPIVIGAAIAAAIAIPLALDDDDDDAS